MKITRRNSKIKDSSIDKRLSFTSTKYKGYRISLDHKNNCYNIYDKHGELEDSGFTSQLAAKEVIDKLVKDSGVNASTSTSKLWMAKYYPVDGVVKKVYFEGPASISRAEKLFEKSISEPYKKYVFLGSAPSEKLAKQDGFSYMEVNASKNITASKGYEKDVFYPNGNPVTDVDMCKYLGYNFGEDRDMNPDHYTTEEKQRSVDYWFQKNKPSPYISSSKEIKYLDNQETLSELIDELASSGVDIYDAQDILQALGADYGYDRDDQFAILEDIQEYVGEGINSAEEIDDELETTEQEFTSKDTSINSSKLPVIEDLTIL